MAKNLLEFTNKGIYCKQGDFYIDPWQPVDYALITHAHSDHARSGSKNYLAQHLSKEILYYRLGAEINLQTIAYNEKLIRNGVTISLHPAGHIIGSAQIRIEYKGEIWVVSGDYKLEDDGVSTPFEAVKCHSFITESTFGMPVYKWKPQNEIFNEVNSWWNKNKSEGKTSLLIGYSLGKAQRLLQNVDHSIAPIFAHGVIANTNDALIRNGIQLFPTQRITKETTKDEVKGALILAPPSAVGTPYMRRFFPYSLGYCSGWMSIRGAKKRRAADRGFVLSDHADWEGLLTAVKATEAENIYVTHGYTATFAKYLNENGWNAQEVHTLYGGDEGVEETILNQENVSETQ